MKKLLLLLLLSLGLTSISFADYLDSWANSDLCGWTTSSSTPKHIANEIKKRNVSCSRGGKAVTIEDANGGAGIAPSDFPVQTEDGTLFPSPDPSLIPEIKPGDSGSGSNKPPSPLPPIGEFT